MVCLEMEKDLKESTWWNKFAGKSPKEASVKDFKYNDIVKSCWDSPVAPRQWQGFEFADVLEQGLGPGLSSSFVEPPADEDSEIRLLVEVNTEKKTYLLTTEAGDSLLIASTLPDGTGFDLFATSDGNMPKGLGCNFTLRCNGAKDSWSLSSVRCEMCDSRGKRQCGTRELAKLSHYCETVGDGNAFCMDVELPEEPKDGSSNVVCSVCTDPDAEIIGHVLSSRRPKWNARQKTLTLDFRGRCSMASAKNFQLEDPEDASKAKLLFGKVSKSQFVLDYRRPLGMVQAFSAALTASHWK
eukprot:TRINITY_DN35951_c0_g1_i1.p1 TRINITY_DN35951_c0_g1~~TRINITY_DN35951_c0_g1_i1.p1  ORF type:complete len:298 (+),score=58.97 TRINITY_DN35951_c0_g1_i1:92-985(+)